MRALTLPVLGTAAVLLLTAWKPDPSPPKCVAANVRAGNGVRANGYYVACGPARAIVRARGRSFSIQGGICYRPQGENPAQRWLSFGVVTQRARPHRGLLLVLRPGNRPGHVSVIDGQLELVPGVRVAVSGTAVVTKGLDGGTFALFGRSAAGPTGSRFTGSWTCS